MKRILIAASLLLAAAPAAAQAQDMATSRPAQFGVMAGATIPMGDLGDAVGTGYHIGGLVNFKPSMVPVGLRAEVTYNKMSGKDIDFGGVTANLGDYSNIAGTINALYEFGAMGTTTVSHPYIIGGLGAYSSKVEDSDRSTDFGFNAGVGIRFGLGGLSTFAEARLHNVFVGGSDGEGSSSARYVPISFGITF